MYEDTYDWINGKNKWVMISITFKKNIKERKILIYLVLTFNNRFIKLF